MLEVNQLETNDTINIVNNAFMQYLQCLLYHWFLIVWLHALFTMFIVSLVSNCLTSSIIYNAYCQLDTNDTINIVNNAWSQTIRNQWYNKHCK
jgi:hypothetical protein